MSGRFSSRNAVGPVARDITVREDAPSALRDAVQALAHACGLGPFSLLTLVSGVLLTRPQGNWSQSYVEAEVHNLLTECEWYRVYDIIEEIHAWLVRKNPPGVKKFTDELNRFFIEKGIGWKLEAGKIETRGAEVFEASVASAHKATDVAGLPTAMTEVHSALASLSRRPEPDLTGAVTHAMGALECVARELTGDRKGTLGEIIKRTPGLFPPPLDKAADKLWGFATQHARHIEEGKTVGRAEAELIVGIATNLVTFLVGQSGRAVGDVTESGTVSSFI